MKLRFHTLDVFTDRTFGGNPLGVFPDATHLPTELMQRVAREMNLSETVFLGPPESPDGDARVRIFTPGVEVPFAGHPTVGTAIFLAGQRAGSGDRGAATGHSESQAPESSGVRADAADAADAADDDADTLRLVLDENVGPVPVTVRLEGGRPVFAQFTTALLPEHRPSPHSAEELARLVGLEPSDIGSADGAMALEPETVSCGLPYHCIPVRSIEAVRRSVLDLALFHRMLAGTWAHHVYLVCLDGEGVGVDVRVRMYAPGSGVMEDPATGSAAAALGGYLAKADGRDEGSLSWTVEQGLEMGRPSLLYVEADRANGETSAVRVGGSAVFVSEGTMTVPDSP